MMVEYYITITVLQKNGTAVTLSSLNLQLPICWLTLVNFTGELLNKNRWEEEAAYYC
jgi:hypothetical protein